MQFSKQVTSITRTTVIPELFDEVNVGSPFTMSLLAQGKEWRTGTKYELPFKHKKSTNGGVVGIADKLDTDREDNRSRLEFEPKAYTKPVVIAEIEKVLNKGDERVLDMITTELYSQMNDLLDGVADEFYAGTGVGDRWDSITMAADDSTNYGTYGNKSRSTYSALNGYLNTSVGNLDLSIMATAFDNTEHGTSGPSEVYTTKTLWSAYEALLDADIAANYTAQGNQIASISASDGIVMGKTALSGTAGYKAVTYRGEPVMKDEKCPSGEMFFVNSRMEGKFRNYGFAQIDFSGEENFSTVNFKKENGAPKGTFGSKKAPTGFNFRDMMSPVDQLAKVGHLFLHGNTFGRPRLQGRLTGVTAA